MKQIAQIIAIASLLFFVVSCSNSEQAEQVESKPEVILSVKATIVESGDRTIVRTYTGSIEGEKQAVLYARLAEAVGTIHKGEGSRVNKDDIIMELNRDGATANYHRIKSLYENSKKNAAKMKNLYDQGAVSESAYDAAQTDFDVNAASYDAVRRMVEIQSPVAGTVTSIDVTSGQFVAVGQKLATVASTDKLRIKIGVNTSDINRFEVGTEVTITGDGDGVEAIGTIATIAGSADPATRTFQVEILFGNENGMFRPGMFVRVLHVHERFESILTVAHKSIILQDGSPTVFTVTNGKAVRCSLTLGGDLGSEAIVLSGLKAGDTLVTLGQDYLDDGTFVNVTSLNGSTK